MSEIVATNQTTLVVSGGISGISAALEVAETGKDAILVSMWICTSCYSCIVRCPRELPITHIMHGLAHYATRMGLARKHQPTRKFSQIFWANLLSKGRVNETRSIESAMLATPVGLSSAGRGARASNLRYTGKPTCQIC